MVGITGRRTTLLQEIKSRTPNKIIIKVQDITDLENSEVQMNGLFQQIGTVDLFIVSSGFGETNQKLDWTLEKKTIDTNVNGIAKVYEFAFSKFKEQGHGHLVGISSIASVRGNRFCPAYSAAKAFQANYLEALRGISKKRNLKIKVTDVQPGFVDTAWDQGYFGWLR